jgi:hypothetical protein
MPPHHPQPVLLQGRHHLHLPKRNLSSPSRSAFLQPRSELTADRALARDNAAMLRSPPSYTATDSIKGCLCPLQLNWHHSHSLLEHCLRALSILCSLALKTGFQIIRSRQTLTDPSRRFYTLSLLIHHDHASATAAQRASKPLNPRQSLGKRMDEIEQVNTWDSLRTQAYLVGIARK